MISGTVIGFICVVALLVASILLALLDVKEKRRGDLAKSRFLSRAALVLFLVAFVGGVVVTLARGIGPRQEDQATAGSMMAGASMGGGSLEGALRAGGPMGAGPMGGGAIGKIDEEELARLKSKVEANPNDVKSRERLGHLYLQMQDFENVFKMAHEALQVNPKSVESRAHMGMVLFAMQDSAQAMRQFDQALAIDPKNLEVLLDKGIVQYQGLDDLKGAKTTWERFMKIAKPTDTGYERVRMFLDSINSQLTN